MTEVNPNFLLSYWSVLSAYWPVLSAFSFLALPVLISMADFLPGFKASNKKVIALENQPSSCEDFSILVPIYGNIKYLENLEFLKTCARQVFLCTTASESTQFYQELNALSKEHGFKILKASIDRGTQASKRATTAPIRDAIMREAIQHVSSRYVVCLDADSWPERDFRYYVGAMHKHNIEVTSSCLVPINKKTFLGKLQVIEYLLSMKLRRIIPWLVSGGCHAASTEAYKAIMTKHSMFFQGNDVEVGVLATRMGFNVGYIPFKVNTSVPDTLKSWYRQRYAWSGGEWRLGMANIKLALQFPMFFFYLSAIMLGMFPIRWISVWYSPWILPYVYLIYIAIVGILCRKNFSWFVVIYPLYSFFNSLIMTPLGFFAYFHMSIQHSNWGQIDLNRQRSINEKSVLKTLDPVYVQEEFINNPDKTNIFIN